VFGWLFRAVDAWRHRLRLRRQAPHLAWGARAEDLAHRYLESRGMKVIARNWRRQGRKQEIDLVALDGDRVVVVEVKSRHDALYAAPDRNMDAAKRGNTIRAALDFAMRHRVGPEQMRFDLVTVVFEPFSIEHTADAWSLKSTGRG
jgi:putative endonuclease